MMAQILSGGSPASRRLPDGHLLLAAVLALVALQVQAEDEDEGRITADMLAGQVDLAIPDAPAFAILNVQPEKIMRPATGKALALGLLSGLDPRGNSQVGIALDTRPYFLIQGDALTARIYREDMTRRQLSRIRLSFATASGQSSDDKANRYALGLSWTPWDQGDPRLDQELSDCFNKKISLGGVIIPLPGESDEDFEKRKEKLQAERAKAAGPAAKACIKQSQERNWNAGAWDLGLAGYNMDADEAQESGYGLWSSLAFRISQWGQFIAHARMMDKELVPDEAADTGYRVQDSWLTGARLRFGSSRGSLMLEGSYSEIDPDEGSRFNNTYAAAGIEYKLREGMWIQLAVSDTFGDNPDDDSTVMSAQFKWGTSDERVLGF